MNIIVTTREELHDIISSALASMNKQEKKPVIEKKWLKVDDALEIVNSKGIKMKKSYMYVLVSNGEIPHYKSGRAILFDKKELEQWAENRPKSPRALMEAESIRNINKSAKAGVTRK